MTPSIPRRQGGFSIVELMIGVALGLVILAALTSFFVNTSANRHEIERTSRQIENGRYAIDAVRSELRVAAFYAELSQSSAAISKPSPCEVDLAALEFKVSPLTVPVEVFGYAADSPAFPICITDRVADTDVVVIRRFDTELTTPAVAATTPYMNQVFVQMSRCNTDSLTTPWVMAYGGDTASFSLRNTGCSAPTSLYRYHVETYYVRNYSDVAGDNIPTLVKLELDNKNIRVSPVVEGIRAFRVSYGIDNNNDGAPDEYRRCDNVASCNDTQWKNVVGVRVSLLAENLEDSRDYTDTKTYDLDGFSPPVFNDHRKRHVYAALVSLPNRTGPREN